MLSFVSGMFQNSIAGKEVAGVDFFRHVGKGGVGAVGEDGSRKALELGEVVDHARPEEGGAVGKRRLVDNHGGAFGLDALHHALD